MDHTSTDGIALRESQQNDASIDDGLLVKRNVNIRMDIAGVLLAEGVLCRAVSARNWIG